MAKIVGERDCFRQVLVQSQGARDCPADRGHFDRMSQARAQVIACSVQKNLRLVLEPAKSTRMNNTRPVALKFHAVFVPGLRIFSTARVARFLGKWREGSALRRLHCLSRPGAGSVASPTVLQLHVPSELPGSGSEPRGRSLLDCLLAHAAIISLLSTLDQPGLAALEGHILTAH